MSAHRKLTLMNTATESGWVEDAIKVAFCSTDMKTVNQHFGAASAFAIFAVDKDRYTLSEVIQFGDLAKDGNEDKLVTKIRALEGCVAVYLQAIGASAIAKLSAIQVQPVKVSHGAPVEELIEALQEELRDGPRSWLARALDKEKDPSRFDQMDEEGWDE